MMREREKIIKEKWKQREEKRERNWTEKKEHNRLKRSNRNAVFREGLGDNNFVFLAYQLMASWLLF
jgi:hypothetical protein